MDEDLNVPEALAALYGFLRAINSLVDSDNLSRSGKEAVIDALRRADSVLGVMEPEKAAAVSAAVKARVEKLILERGEARRRGDYARADEIRAQLKSEGITLEDRPGGGTYWKKD